MGQAVGREYGMDQELAHALADELVELTRSLERGAARRERFASS